MSEEENALIKQCWRQNVLYVSYCLRCKKKGIKSQYICETGKSLRWTAKKHLEKLKYWDPSNFMPRYNIMYHHDEDPRNNEYSWKQTHICITYGNTNNGSNKNKGINNERRC